MVLMGFITAPAPHPGLKPDPELGWDPDPDPDPHPGLESDPELVLDPYPGPSLDPNPVRIPSLVCRTTHSLICVKHHLSLSRASNPPPELLKFRLARLYVKKNTLHIDHNKHFVAKNNT